MLVSNEPCRKLAGKLLRFCGIRRIKNKKRTFLGERAPRNVLFLFLAWLIARKKSTIPKAPVSSKMVLAVDRQGFEPWTP